MEKRCCIIQISQIIVQVSSTGSGYRISPVRDQAKKWHLESAGNSGETTACSLHNKPSVLHHPLAIGSHSAVEFFFNPAGLLHLTSSEGKGDISPLSRHLKKCSLILLWSYLSNDLTLLYFFNIIIAYL